MAVPGWMGRFAQPWLPRGGKTTHRRVQLRLEVLEDRLTPSGDVLASTSAAPSLGSNQLTQTVLADLEKLTQMLGQQTATLDQMAQQQLGGAPVQSLGSSSIVQMLDALGKALSSDSLTIPAGSSSTSFAPSWGGTSTLALSATQQEIVQGLSSLAFTTSPQTLTASASGPSATQTQWIAPTADQIHLTNTKGNGSTLIVDPSVPDGFETTTA